MSYNKSVFNKQVISDIGFLSFLEFYENEYTITVLLEKQKSKDFNDKVENSKSGSLFTKEKMKSMLVKFFTTEYYDSTE